MKTYQKGMTFIELLIGMVLIGVVAAMAVPRYVDAAQQAKDDALWEQTVAVKNTHDAVVNKGAMPSVADLAAEMKGEGLAVDGGVQVSISGEAVVIPTYTNSLCTEPTKSVNDTVGCVGAVAG